MADGRARSDKRVCLGAGERLERGPGWVAAGEGSGEGLVGWVPAGERHTQERVPVGGREGSRADASVDPHLRPSLLSRRRRTTRRWCRTSRRWRSAGRRPWAGSWTCTNPSRHTSTASSLASRHVRRGGAAGLAGRLGPAAEQRTGGSCAPSTCCTAALPTHPTLPLPGCPSPFAQVDYFTYVSSISDFAVIPRPQRLTRPYRDYLAGLVGYLESFYERTQPLAQLSKHYEKVGVPKTGSEGLGPGERRASPGWKASFALPFPLSVGSRFRRGSSPSSAC